MMLPRATLWIKGRPEGSGSNRNRSAIGPRVLLCYAGKVQAQWVRSQSSFLSASDPRLHFGLGTAAKVSVEVHLAAGTSESQLDLAADQLVTIRKGQGIVKGPPFR
jgi:hypothetical protein